MTVEDEASENILDTPGEDKDDAVELAPEGGHDGWCRERIWQTLMMLLPR